MLYTIEGKKNKNVFPYDEVMHKTERSIVTTNGENIFKQYTENESDYNKFNIQTFKVIRSIKSPNLIELYDGYFDSYKKYLKSLISKGECIDAYTAKYYKKNNTHILLRDTEFIIDNLRRIEQLIDEFNNEHVVCDDVHASNTIITDDDIVIIDPDMFYIDIKRSLFNSKRFNKWIIISLFRELFCKSSDEFTIRYIDVYQLFDMDLTPSTSITKNISRRLEPYKKPIDYFRNR